MTTGQHPKQRDTPKPLKILWNSNAPWSTSGYGNQTSIVTRQMKNAGHDVAISCFYGLEGGTIEWDGIPCYPTDHSRFGALLLGEYADRHGRGDRSQVHTFLLQDVWCMLQGLPNLQGCKLVAWTPVDHDPCPPMVAEFLQRSGAQTIAMTEFGADRLQKAGVEPVATIPLVVDCDIFKPDRANRNSYRDGLKLPHDAFVIGMVAMNQGLPPRKSFPEVFEAFQRFQAKHSDAVLYVHSDVQGRNNGVNLIKLAEVCGIPTSALATSDQLALHLGIAPELVAGVFNAMDVLACPSGGEGFGLPLVEAQACGVPIVTTDFTAMTELCGAGWLVDGDKFYDATQHSFFKKPNVAEIVDAFEQAYDKAAGLGEQARQFAVQYDANLVWERDWLPMLDQLARPREVQPLRLVA